MKKTHQLLTRDQVAERWKCCSHTIARHKDLPKIKLGPRLVRYRLEDVEAVEAAKMEDPRQPKTSRA